MEVNIKRKDVRFYPDSKKVVAQITEISDDSVKRIIETIAKMPDKEVETELGQVLRDYVKRHRNITRIFEKNFNEYDYLFEETDVDISGLSHDKKILIGSYFTKEYSIESAALFNPSIVLHPDQTELEPGEKRIIISFRATGENHISSVVFRSGVIDKNNTLRLRPSGNKLNEAEKVVQHVYDKKSFKNKLDMMKFYDNTLPPSEIIKHLDDKFTFKELRIILNKTKKTYPFPRKQTLTIDQILWLASSHYEIEFSLDTSLSERVIFPIAGNEKNGTEDARFVRFTDDDGSTKYFATFTAWDGSIILPKLLETNSFYKFKISPLEGDIVSDKGMALFPRKIKGKYAMLCRIDGVNNWLAYSDDVRTWNDATMIQRPEYPWELVKTGNCGSPLETTEGWLVLTHGVGPMKEYVFGASLFDLDDPSKEIGRLKTPLMMPDEDEREGYVPNVIYSCGAMINNNELVIPYGISDYASTYACVDLDELITALKK